MIKFIGICVLFLSARIFYENYIYGIETEIKNTEDMILFSNLLYVNVMELKMPFELAISSLKFKISPFVDELIRKTEQCFSEKKDDSLRQVLLKNLSEIKLNRKIKTELEQFFRVIGTMDKEMVLNYKKNAIKNSEVYLSEHKKQSESRRKTAGAVALGTSAVLIVILI